MPAPNESPPTIVVKPRRALPFFGRHPWLFAGAVREVTGSPQPGGEVVVRSSNGEFIARGLFNPHSNIRVRLYSWEEDEPLDDALWAKRIQTAIDGRIRLFGEFSPVFSILSARTKSVRPDTSDRHQISTVCVF